MALVRGRSIAIALPLALGLACSHGRSSQAQAEPSAQQREPAQAAQDISPTPAEPLAGHSDDLMLSGRVLDVTPESVSIDTRDGQTKTLEIVPQTVVTLDGQSATPADIQQGQEVRASYNTQDGRDVAVTISASRPSDKG